MVVLPLGDVLLDLLRVKLKKQVGLHFTLAVEILLKSKEVLCEQLFLLLFEESVFKDFAADS